MSNIVKNFDSRSILYLIIAFSVFISVSSCKQRKTQPLELHGNTMGTTYTIKMDRFLPNVQTKIDSALVSINSKFSTYDSTSQISKINQPKAVICFKDENLEFKNLLSLSQQINIATNGYFDPTVMPLVNYWGFGPIKNKQDTIDNSKIDSVLNFVGLEKLQWSNDSGELCFTKDYVESSLDLSAIAKGYAVDEIASLISDLGAESYMVEIGGEVRAKGVNKEGEVWKIGIDRPETTSNLNERKLQAIVKVQDKALASSGNYRNFYKINDDLIGHTINPKTGRPEVNNLLAVSVLANNCATADGYATGFMAMGLDLAKQIVASDSNLDAYFIYLDSSENIKVYYSEGFEKYLVEAK